MAGILTHLRRLKNGCLDALASRFTRWTKPLETSLPLATLTDLGRSKSELIAEIVFLRKPLIILRRQVKRPACTKTDRICLVLLARLVRTWQQALVIVQPDTLLRWHRELFRLFWKRKSKASSHEPKVAAETIALIRQMAKDNRLWGAERIRGELLKLGILVCKRTIQKYMRNVRPRQPRGQTWGTFLRNHASQIWACDFLQVTDLFFRPLFAFFIVELKSRRVIYVGVTRSPSDPWVAQQLREATPFGQAPKYLIRDNDSKFGTCFAQVARTSNIKILKTPYHAPRANAICERFPRSVRQECLDHLLIMQERQHEPCPQCLCGLLQPSTTASRDWATDSRAPPIGSFPSGCREQADCSSGHGWAAPRLPLGSLKGTTCESVSLVDQVHPAHSS